MPRSNALTPLGWILPSVFFLLYLAPLGLRPMIMPDEFRYAEIPREMLASGNWVVPHLNGLRYFEKPPLGYWTTAVSIAAFGKNAFAARLPAALATGLSALLIFRLVRRFSGSTPPSVLSTAIYLTSIEVFALGTYNALDSQLSLWLTGGLVTFFYGYMESNAWRRRLWLALFGLCCGLAFLAKGFLAFALPISVIVPFMLWERRWQDLFTWSVIPLITAAIVTLPWAIAIHSQEGDFWHYFFWVEHVHRFLSDDAAHAEPFWYYLPVLVAGALPWSLLFPAALSGLYRTGFQTLFLRYTLLWFGMPFLFFSSSSGKLPTYILPCFPPLAILTGLGLWQYFEQGKRIAFNRGAILGATLAGIAALVLVIIQVIDVGFRPYDSTENVKWLLGTLALLGWSGFSLFAARVALLRTAFRLYCVVPIFLMATFPFLFPNQTIMSKAPGEFLRRYADTIDSDTLVMSDAGLIHAVCWSFQRDDVYLTLKRGELSYGLMYPDANHRFVSVDQFQWFVEKNATQRPVIFVYKAKSRWKYGDLGYGMRVLGRDGSFVLRQADRPVDRQRNPSP